MADQDDKPTEDSQEQGEAFVPRDALKKALDEKNALQSKYKEAEAKRQELEEMIASKAREEMEAKQEFEKLYQTEKQKREATEERLNKNNQLFKDTMKKSALKQALGGQVKDQYLAFADIGAIEMDEAGRISEESIKTVAEKFMEEHPGLVPTTKAPNPTGPNGKGTPGTNVDVEKMDREQLFKLIRDNL